MPNTISSGRENARLITASVDGVSLGSFEQRSGGEVTSTSTQYSLAGMGPRIALGGRQETTDVVIRKIFDDDIRARLKRLAARVGKAPMVVADQPLDIEGNASGDAFIWTGVLRHVKMPDANSESDAASVCELQMSVTGPFA